MKREREERWTHMTCGVPFFPGTAGASITTCSRASVVADSAPYPLGPGVDWSLVTPEPSQTERMSLPAKKNMKKGQAGQLSCS